jgi:hypothetical protein
MITIRYVYGDDLEQSYFIASDEKGNERVARASSVIPQSLHKMASANKMKTEPEHFIAELSKLCTDLDSFDRITAELGAGDRELKVTAAKGDGPTMATEPTPAPKTPAQPVVAAEEGLTQKPSGAAPAPDTKKLYGQLPGKVGGETEQAVDVNSSEAATAATPPADAAAKPAEGTGSEAPPATETPAVEATELEKKDAQLKAMAEEIGKKDEEIKGLKDKADSKEKEEKAAGVVKALQEQGVDAKIIEKLKGELAKQSEPVLGLVERVIEAVAGVAAKKGEGKPAGAPGAPGGPGAPPWEKKAASKDDLDLTAGNLSSVPHVEEPMGGATERIATLWSGIDRGKEVKDNSRGQELVRAGR